jgi:hypothetical protein
MDVLLHNLSVCEYKTYSKRKKLNALTGIFFICINISVTFIICRKPCFLLYTLPLGLLPLPSAGPCHHHYHTAWVLEMFIYSLIAYPYLSLGTSQFTRVSSIKDCQIIPYLGRLTRVLIRLPPCPSQKVKVLLC